MGNLTKAAASGSLIWCLSTLPLAAQDVTWVPADGNIQLADGTPICAMVLANGQYMFSCDGAGLYDLDVPLDGNGQITLFAFADGFAPFSFTTGPANFPFTVQMQTATPDSPQIIDPLPPLGCASDARIRIAGTVTSDSGDELCAMVLANGHYMFSCGEYLGEYDLTVPVDGNGEITLFKFADGFQPYSDTFLAPQCEASLYDGLYIGTATSSTAYGFNGGPCGSAQFEFTIAGAGFSGFAWDTWGRTYSVEGTVDAAGNIRFALAAALTNVATATGNVAEGSAGGTWSDVYGCSGPWTAQKR